MDMPKLQNMDLPKIDNPFVGGSAMWQSLNPPVQQMLPKEDSEKLSKEKTYESGTVERERIQAIQKAKKQAIRKEEENGSAVVDSKEVVGPVAGAPEADLVAGGETDCAPDAESIEISARSAEDFTLVA
jgi:hypothetical protein